MTTLKVIHTHSNKGCQLASRRFFFLFNPADSLMDKLKGILQAEFLLDPFPVSADGLGAKSECSSNLFGVQSSSYGLQDLKLAAGKSIQRGDGTGYGDTSGLCGGMITVFPECSFTILPPVVFLPCSACHQLQRSELKQKLLLMTAMSDMPDLPGNILAIRPWHFSLNAHF